MVRDLWGTACTRRLGACILFSTLICWWITQHMSMTEAGGGSIASFVAVTLIVGLVSLPIIFDRHIRSEGVLVFGFYLLSTFSLLLMAIVFVSDGGQAYYVDSNMASLLDADSYAEGIRWLLMSTIIPASTKFYMDGDLDKWVFVLFNNGFSAIGYEEMGVQERGIVYIYAAIMRAFGSYDPRIYVLTNWGIHSLSSLLLFSIVRNIFDRKSAVLAAAIFIVFPENIYWSGILFKDVIVVFLVLLSAYSALFLRNDMRWIVYLTLLFLTIAGLLFVRSGLVLPVYIAALLSSILITRAIGWNRLVSCYALLASMLVVMVALLPTPISDDLIDKTIGRTWNKLAYGSTLSLDHQNITYRTTKEDSLIERFGGGDISISNIYYVPIRIAAYISSPIPPWPSGTLSSFMVTASTWLLLAFIPFFLKTILNVWASSNSNWVLLGIFFLMTGVAVSFAGPFILERYRIIMTPFILSIAAPSIVHSSWSIRCKLLSLVFVFTSLITTFWFFLKH